MKLVKTTRDTWIVHDGPVEFEGTWPIICHELQHSWDVALEELNAAVTYMDLKQHDTAHFGVDRTFLFTSNSTEVACKLVELEAIRDMKDHFRVLARNDINSPETKLAHFRLISLYNALDVRGLLALLEDKYETWPSSRLTS